MKLVRSATRPSRQSLHQRADLWLVFDSPELDLAAEELTGTAARDAVPPRTEKGALEGLRALWLVPAGDLDIVVSETGEFEREGGP